MYFSACRDRISRCASYGAEICTLYRSWAEKQCPCFCKFDQGRTHHLSNLFWFLYKIKSPIKTESIRTKESEKTTDDYIFQVQLQSKQITDQLLNQQTPKSGSLSQINLDDIYKILCCFRLALRLQYFLLTIYIIYFFFFYKKLIS